MMMMMRRILEYDNDAQVGMSMMENPNLMDAANFGGPQSPIGEYIMMIMMMMVMMMVMMSC